MKEKYLKPSNIKNFKITNSICTDTASFYIGDKIYLEKKRKEYNKLYISGNNQKQDTFQFDTTNEGTIYDQYSSFSKLPNMLSSDLLDRKKSLNLNLSFFSLVLTQDTCIPIYFFVGNHDMWMNGYFEKELNIKVFHKPHKFVINNKKFLIGHGDGLGPGDIGFKRMKKLFKSSIAKFLFKWVHPDFGIRIAQYLSTKNKLLSGKEDVVFKGEENEWLAQYCKKILKQENFDFFLFGHRHLPLDIKLSEDSRYINLGDWISYFSYAVFDGTDIELKFQKDKS